MINPSCQFIIKKLINKTLQVINCGIISRVKRFITQRVFHSIADKLPIESPVAFLTKNSYEFLIILDKKVNFNFASIIGSIFVLKTHEPILLNISANNQTDNNKVIGFIKTDKTFSLKPVYSVAVLTIIFVKIGPSAKLEQQSITQIKGIY